jgi:uncharacterized membrane protein
MSSRTTQWISLGLVLLALLVSVALYGRLPELVATHFNLAGEPDRWSDRLTAAVSTPALMGFTGAQPWVLGVVIGSAALVPVIYSFFAYRAVEGFKPPPEQ